MGKSGIFLLIAIVGATLIIAIMLVPLALGLAIIPHGGGGGTNNTNSTASNAVPPTSNNNPAKPSKPHKPNDSFSGDGASGGGEVPAIYPVLEKLPYTNQYWRLDVLDQSVTVGPLSLVASVFVQPDASAETEIAKQRPFVEAWLAANGQVPGTYAVDYQTEVAPGS